MDIKIECKTPTYYAKLCKIYCETIKKIMEYAMGTVWKIRAYVLFARKLIV